MTTSAERTIGLGCRRALGKICERLGIGEYRPTNKHISSSRRPPAGWFVSPEEMKRVLAERRTEERAIRDRFNAMRRSKSRRNYKRTERPVRSSSGQIERVRRTWLREWLDPQSPRRTPEECWVYAVRSCMDLREEEPLPPMPSDELPPRLPRTVVTDELAGRRADHCYGRAETEHERDARLTRERRRAQRTPSAGTARAQDGGRNG